MTGGGGGYVTRRIQPSDVNDFSCDLVVLADEGWPRRMFISVATMSLALGSC